MEIACDPAKSASNIELRGLSFERAADFDFETAKIWQDLRKPYLESRFVAIG